MLLFTCYFNVKGDKQVINLSLISKLFKKRTKKHRFFVIYKLPFFFLFFLFFFLLH